MTISLDADLSAPSSARDFVGDQLDLLDADPHSRWPREDVVLVVSELVTNSLQAGARTISVRIRVKGDQLELEVTDDAEGLPVPRQAQADETHGRGLTITAILADHWSVSTSPRKGVTASWRHVRS